jgi:soluble lytic murein transglycosylase-like protein
MRWILAIFAFSGMLAAQSIPAPAAPAAPEPARSTMASAIEKQRASVLKQVTSITGKAAAPGTFFTVPWVDGMAAGRFVPPPCDPMATAELEQLIDKNSKEQGVKSDLIRAVINQESGNRPCAVSSKGAQGLMQLMPETADELGVGDPFNAKQNVEAGTKLLKQLLAKYKGDVSLTLAAYNAGSGRVDREGGVPAIPETLEYVTQILARLPKR